MKKLVLVASLALAGCGTLSALNLPESSGSYVSPEVGPESGMIAKDMVAFLASQLPAAKTTLSLAPTNTQFHQDFVDELKRRGFGVSEGVPVQDSVEVYYAVSLLDRGVVVRMSFQGKEATRFYVRSGVEFALGGRYALREATNE